MELPVIKRLALYFAILLAAAFCFCAVLPYIYSCTIRYQPGNDYKVLLVGDFSSTNSVDKADIKMGFYTAMRSRKNNEMRFKPDVIDIDESSINNQINGISETETEALNIKIKNKLISKIAGENVVAIVTSSQSQTIDASLETGKMFNIPVLVVRASDTKCMENYKSIGFRLIPNNVATVPRIKQWVISNIKPLNKRKRGPENDSTETLGILYTPTRYGINMRDELTAALSDYNVMTFPISTTGSIVYAMTPMGPDSGHLNNATLGIKKWIAICYEDEAKNIMAFERQRWHLNPRDDGDTILFCDAAYGYWMKEFAGDSAYRKFYVVHSDNIMLFDSDAAYASRNPANTYSQVAEDAYYLLEYCLQNPSSAAKVDIIKNLTALGSNTPNAEWHFDYAFWLGHNGENGFARPELTRLDQIKFQGEPKKAIR